MAAGRGGDRGDPILDVAGSSGANSKGSSGDYCGIGLLEVVWKLTERVIDKRLSKIELHDTLRNKGTVEAWLQVVEKQPHKCQERCNVALCLYFVKVFINDILPPQRGASLCPFKIL